MTHQRLFRPREEDPMERYADRLDAGRALAAELVGYRGQGAVVLALPRGGVPVAWEIARAIEAELDVLVVRKLGAPGHEELAIGAVTADGTRVVNEDVVRAMRVTREQLEAVTGRERDNARRRELRLRGGLRPPNVGGRVVIVVDDGLATGATMRAAIASLRMNHPRKLIVAVPVGAPDTCHALAAEVDALVCPHRPEPFHSVGRYYAHFDQTSDEEVIDMLHQHRASSPTAAKASATRDDNR